MEKHVIRRILVAAKYHIRTPEAYEALGRSRSAALYQATSTWQEYMAADEWMGKFRVRGTGYTSVIDMFDRAIEALDK